MWWLFACGSPSVAPEPAPPPPEPPPPLCEPVACLAQADEARRAGDLERAAALYDARCEARPGDVACTLAERVREQEGLATACAGGTSSACQELCTRSRDAAPCTTAAAAWEAECAEGSGAACLRRAEALDAAGADAQQVNELLWVACDDTDPVEPWACLRLADRVERGVGALPKAARGDVAWLRNQACDLQLDYACAPHRGW